MNPKRLRIFQLVDILRRETDAENPISTSQLCAKLDNCDRKTIYRDIDMLIEAGFEIYSRMESKDKVYYMMDRQFNAAELKVLMDAVQAAAFIPETQTKTLIEKIACLAGERKSELLQKGVVGFNTKKHSNEEIFLNIDAIERALREGSQVAFYYFDLDEHVQRQYRHDKKRYAVEPIALIYNSDNYYLRSYSPENNEMRNYRVDRMEQVEVLEDSISESARVSDKELAEYTETVFSMYSGTPENVVLQFDNSLLGVVYDQFGEDTTIARKNKTTCMAFVKVQISGPFWGWLMQFPDKMGIVSPDHVAAKFREWKKKEYVPESETANVREEN